MTNYQDDHGRQYRVVGRMPYQELTIGTPYLEGDEVAFKVVTGVAEVGHLDGDGNFVEEFFDHTEEMNRELVRVLERVGVDDDFGDWAEL